MKKENFERAQEIQDELKGLKNHLDTFVKYKEPIELACKMSADGVYYKNVPMTNELLPIEIESFMDRTKDHLISLGRTK